MTEGKLPVEPLRVATHSGSFHADEVFALATLRLHFGVIGIIRTRDPEELAACDLRIDVGRKYDPESGDFDHHQGDAGERANGIRYASFGLVWKSFGAQVCGSEAIADRAAEPGATAEWLSRMLRGTSALLDTAAARSLLDRPTARAVLSRFGGPAESDGGSADADPEHPQGDRDLEDELPGSGVSP